MKGFCTAALLVVVAALPGSLTAGAAAISRIDTANGEGG
jgi:hypothetical protein